MKRLKRKAWLWFQIIILRRDLNLNVGLRSCDPKHAVKAFNKAKVPDIALITWQKDTSAPDTVCYRASWQSKSDIWTTTNINDLRLMGVNYSSYSNFKHTHREHSND